MSDFSRENVSRENFSRETFSRENVSRVKFSMEKFTREKFSRELFSRLNFSRGYGNRAHSFPAFVTEMAALMAAPVLHVVRWRCLTPRGVLKPARSTSRFQAIHRNKAATDTAGHIPSCSTCMS